jgi:hypothetical protein
MRIYGIDVDTDAALITVNMIIRTPNPTDSALLTVVLALVLIIQENTYGTPIGAHGCVTRFTDLLGVLNSLTRYAFDLLDSLSVHSMGFLRVLLLLVFLFVMTEPAGKEFLAARG